jgi:sarcosine oxidase subunit alpha
MNVDGIPNVRTCITPLREGMDVRMQEGFAEVPNIRFEGSKRKRISTDVLVIGGGPAGLSAAIEGARNGAEVLLVDENPRLGGQLIKQTHKFFGSREERAGTRGIEIAVELTKEVEEKVRVFLQSSVFGYYEEGKEHVFGLVKRRRNEEIYEVRCKKAVFACGAMENMLVFPGNDLPGVYGAGGVQTLMNVYGVKPGDRVLMVGSGNVGLIVSYQLLQAGVEVVAIIEALPKIGGYHVHAAKIRRCGVPILTSHTIIGAEGKDRVEKARIAELDENQNIVNEKEIRCDSICLAIGLTPSIRLLAQTGADIVFIPEAGGHVALHDRHMETTVEGIYVAGDASGIEEASTAMLEGRIAGLSAVARDEKKVDRYLEELDRLRAGEFGERGRKAKERILSIMERKYGRV